jgi:FAD dependent oxidoreductase TIGR03364
VIDRDAQANGASVRNFGFVTITGQERGLMWARARRTREVWQEVAAAAGIPILHTGMWMMVRRPESVRVLEAFVATEMGEGCRIIGAVEARRRCPWLRAPTLAAVLESDTELRVESSEAIPRIAEWLAAAHGVRFLRNTAVGAVDLPNIQTSRGCLQARRLAVCLGDDFITLYAEQLAAHGLTRCKLQMLRLASPGFAIPAALMSDLGLSRYRGYAELAIAAPLQTRLDIEQPAHVQHGVHLIVVQSADGSLIVEDGHHYGDTPDPFSRDDVDALILDEFRAALGIEPPPTLQRWTGTYASAASQCCWKRPSRECAWPSSPAERVPLRGLRSARS